MLTPPNQPGMPRALTESAAIARLQLILEMAKAGKAHLLSVEYTLRTENGGSVVTTENFAGGDVRSLAMTHYPPILD